MGVSSPIKRYSATIIDHDVRVHEALGSRIIAQSFDTANLTTLTNPTDGQVRVARIYLPQPKLITGIGFILSGPGVFTANNNNKVALYSKTGPPAKLAESANTPTMWSVAPTNNLKLVPFTTPYAAPAGLYLAALLWNHDELNLPGGYAPPTIGCRPPTLGIFTSALDYTFGKSYGSQAGQTDMPSSLSSLLGSSTMPWMCFYT